MRDPYWRRARYVRGVDGDTCVLDVDHGFYVTSRHMVRLLGVNTPELHASDLGARGKARTAASFTDHWLQEHSAMCGEAPWPLSIRTEKGDSFGRWLARIECDAGHCLNDDLVALGMAVPFMVDKP